MSKSKKIDVNADKQSKLVRFDWAIKKLLRDKANFNILEGFLSELLSTKIKIINLLESEGNQEKKEDKFNRVDLLVHTENKEKVIIEVQVSSEMDFFQRILYNTSKVITEYMTIGDDYSNVSKVITVSVLFFKMTLEKSYLSKGEFIFKDIKTKTILHFTESVKEFYKEINNRYSNNPTEIYPEHGRIQ